MQIAHDICMHVLIWYYLQTTRMFVLAANYIKQFVHAVKRHYDIHVQFYCLSDYKNTQVTLPPHPHTQFLEHFDREVIPHQYPQVSPHPIDHTVWDSLCLKEQCVRLEVGEIPGWEVNTDKETVLTRLVTIS